MLKKYTFRLYATCLILGLIFLFSCSLTTSLLPSKITPTSTSEPTTLKTYQEILSTGILPLIKPTYKFPVSAQYHNGCFAFAVNHILQYKYASSLDLEEVEKKINKPREDLWTNKHIYNFTTTYSIAMGWYHDAEKLFFFLSTGEPVIMQYKHNLDENTWVGHMVAAYSFDHQGIWVSDSLSNKCIHLNFEQIFETSGIYLQFGFATVEKIL